MEIKNAISPPKSEAKVCLNLQEIPGGGRLAVPDLIKEILTGSGDTEKQVGDILSSQPVTEFLCVAGELRTEETHSQEQHGEA